MEKYIRNRLLMGKIVKILIIACIAMIFLAFTPPFTNGPYFIFVFEGAIQLSVFFIVVYRLRFHPLKKSLERLSPEKLEIIKNDIDQSQLSLPRSNIYCGKKAFFCKKNGLIIPYDDIAWICNTRERRSHKIYLFTRVCTRDGKEFLLNINMSEFSHLITYYIKPKSKNYRPAKWGQMHYFHIVNPLDPVKSKPKISEKIPHFDELVIAIACMLFSLLFFGDMFFSGGKAFYSDLIFGIAFLGFGVYTLFKRKKGGK